MDDPNLRFKPKAQYADVAEGGRIGYANAGDVDKDRPWVPSFMDKILNRMEGSAAQLEEVMGETEEPVSQPVKEEPSFDVQPFWNPKTEEWESVDWKTDTPYNFAKAHSKQTGWSPYMFELIRAKQAGGMSKEEIVKDLYEELNRENTPFRDDMGVTTYGNVLKKKLERYAGHKYPFVNKAQGGRVPAQEGGLMNLGGMEKDYRQEGGFVPIGGEEKADDVPARLSKNEFVFTADAVRAAGGGDIDAGAEVMEKVMENLEAGGKISEESQGLEGAQEMFANTQRLQNRII